MSKKVNKRKNVFQIYGINNCLPILNSSNYNIVDIFLSDDSNTDVKKIFSHKKFISSDFDVNWLVKEKFY